MDNFSTSRDMLLIYIIGSTDKDRFAHGEYSPAMFDLIVDYLKIYELSDYRKNKLIRWCLYSKNDSLLKHLCENYDVNISFDGKKRFFSETSRHKFG